MPHRVGTTISDIGTGVYWFSGGRDGAFCAGHRRHRAMDRCQPCSIDRGLARTQAGRICPRRRRAACAQHACGMLPNFGRLDRDYPRDRSTIQAPVRSNRTRRSRQRSSVRRLREKSGRGRCSRASDQGRRLQPVNRALDFDVQAIRHSRRAHHDAGRLAQRSTRSSDTFVSGAERPWNGKRGHPLGRQVSAASLKTLSLSAPGVGQDSRSVLSAAGYSNRVIDELVQRCVVHTAMATP